MNKKPGGYGAPPLISPTIMVHIWKTETRATVSEYDVQKRETVIRYYSEIYRYTGR